LVFDWVVQRAEMKDWNLVKMLEMSMAEKLVDEKDYMMVGRWVVD
jgi:hypothetical protein